MSSSGDLVSGERIARRFTRMDQALETARGHYPVDFLIAPRGDTRRPSDYALNQGVLEGALSDRGFGKHPDDLLLIWLPK